MSAQPLEAEFKQHLDQADAAQWNEFLRSLETVTAEQDPSWFQITAPGAATYFLGKRAGSIVCSAIIHERKAGPIRTAFISFGPLFRNPDDLVAAILAIRNWYHRRWFLSLGIQLGFPTGATSDYVEAKLNQAIRVHSGFTSDNWSSLRIDLTADEEKIFQQFSKGHKSAIKKALKQGASVRQVESSRDAAALADIYSQMSEARGLAADCASNRSLFQRLFAYFSDTHNGYILAVYDEQQAMLGGIVVVRQGNTMRYYKGAADPTKRDIPILHTAIYEAIKLSKKDGCAFFDLWGYNHYAGPNDQVYNINIFKKGFGGEFVFYPKIMHVSLVPFGAALQRLASSSKKAVARLFSLVHARKRSSVRAADNRQLAQPNSEESCAQQSQDPPTPAHR